MARTAEVFTACAFFQVPKQVNALSSPLQPFPPSAASSPVREFKSSNGGNKGIAGPQVLSNNIGQRHTQVAHA